MLDLGFGGLRVCGFGGLGVWGFRALGFEGLGLRVELRMEGAV